MCLCVQYVHTHLSHCVCECVCACMNIYKMCEQKESVVVFDEAHNIDNVCIEALSVELGLQQLQESSRSLRTLSKEVQQQRQQHQQRLAEEYQTLLQLRELLTHLLLFTHTHSSLLILAHSLMHSPTRSLIFTDIHSLTSNTYSLSWQYVS